MIALVFFLGMLLGQSVLAAPLDTVGVFVDPDMGFKIEVPGDQRIRAGIPVISVKNKRHIQVYWPKLKSKSAKYRFSEGYFKRIKVQRRKNGTVFHFYTRKTASEVLDGMSVSFNSSATLAFKGEIMPNDEEHTVSEKLEAFHKKVDPEIIEPRKLPSLPFKPESKLTLKPRTKVAMGVSSIGTPTDFGVTAILLCLTLVVLGLIAMLAKKQKTQGSESGDIDVVSVKSFGSKHRIALIEACGEKLLVAATDKDVRLLSHLGMHFNEQAENPDDQLTASIARSFKDYSETEKEERKAEEKVESRCGNDGVLPREGLPALESLRMLKSAVRGSAGRILSSDLEGLVKLKEKNSRKNQAKAKATIGSLRDRYKEVAA